MKNLTKKNKVLLLVIAFVIILGVFYWYELRPSMIKMDCAFFAIEKARIYGDKWNPEEYDHQFERCLRENGI